VLDSRFLTEVQRVNSKIIPAPTIVLLLAPLPALGTSNADNSAGYVSVPGHGAIGYGN
jgi:hypothetical protein